MIAMEIVSSDVARVALQILVDGPNWLKYPAEETAIIVLPGMYQEYRITEGVRLWPHRGHSLWVAATRSDPAYTKEDIVRATGVDDPKIVCGGFARHTPDQMEWCVKLLMENPHIKHLIVTTAAYHLVRCVLVNVAAQLKAGIWVPITPIPLYNPCGGPSGENFLSEAEKILEYQASGDVASFEQWEVYHKRRLNA